MPEGDTIHKVAAVLGSLLNGRALVEVRLRPYPDAGLIGQRLCAVHAKGKHLYIETDSGATLRSHLGMYGTWHRYRPGEEWKKPAFQASILIVTETDVVVCFNAREVELLRRPGFRRQDQRHRLGPDLITAVDELPGVPGRARALCPPQIQLVDLLLDQRVAAGIGNVYKCEVCFLQRQPPWRQLATVSDAALVGLYRCASELLRKNLGGGPRRTRCVIDGRGPLWVYSRGDLPCLLCGEPIRCARLGRRPRTTYWCPRCQHGGRAGAA
jgi:endonuclease-8